MKDALQRPQPIISCMASEAPRLSEPRALLALTRISRSLDTGQAIIVIPHLSSPLQALCHSIMPF
jgi:hypothetical protein